MTTTWRRSCRVYQYRVSVSTSSFSRSDEICNTNFTAQSLFCIRPKCKLDQTTNHSSPLSPIDLLTFRQWHFFVVVSFIVLILKECLRIEPCRNYLEVKWQLSREKPLNPTTKLSLVSKLNHRFISPNPIHDQLDSKRFVNRWWTRLTAVLLALWSTARLPNQTMKSWQCRMLDCDPSTRIMHPRQHPRWGRSRVITKIPSFNGCWVSFMRPQMDTCFIDGMFCFQSTGTSRCGIVWMDSFRQQWSPLPVKSWPLINYWSSPKWPFRRQLEQSNKWTTHPI